MTIAEVLQICSELEQELRAKNENFEQALADEREAGKHDRDQEVQGLNDQLIAKQSEFDQMVIQKDQEKIDFGASERKAGFDEGVASVPPCPVSDKLYSQEELDAAVKTAVDSATGPLNEQVEAMRSQIAELQGIVDGIQGRIDEAVAALKAQLLSDYDATQVDDVAFREKLK